MPPPEARPGSGAVLGSSGASAHSPDWGTLALRGDFTQTHTVPLHRRGLACSGSHCFLYLASLVPLPLDRRAGPSVSPGDPKGLWKPANTPLSEPSHALKTKPATGGRGSGTCRRAHESEALLRPSFPGSLGWRSSAVREGQRVSSLEQAGSGCQGWVARMLMISRRTIWEWTVLMALKAARPTSLSCHSHHTWSWGH